MNVQIMHASRFHAERGLSSTSPVRVLHRGSRRSAKRNRSTDRSRSAFLLHAGGMPS